MRNFKKVLALLLALTMVLGMGVATFATNEVAEPVAPEAGSITVNSPVVGATYKVYKVFDMTTNAAVDAFSYTIDTNSPFYAAVKAYADVAENKLTLTPITTEHVDDDPETTDVDESYDKFNVSAEEGFDAQKFGKAMQAIVDGSPAVTDPESGEVITPAVPAIDPVATKTCTTSADDTSDFIKFDELPLGYFLINPTYPPVSAVTVKMGEGTANEVSFTDDDLVKDDDGKVVEPRALTDEAKGKIDTYVKATVDVDKYIEDHGITTNKDGSPLNDAGKTEYKNDLINAMKADAEQKILDAFNNNASEADINVKEPILVFLDSSQPDAVINEKNEIDKWDIPVNPEGDTEPGTPDHGEPEGGKNIIVQEATDTTPAYSADWSEANIGESVHYQLRVNAMNFIRKGDTDATIQQVKEYFLADYQSGHMHFDESQKLKVSVWAGNNNNDSQNGMTNVTKNPDGTVNSDGYLDYTSKSNVFFKNTTDEDANPVPTDIFGTGTGIMVPWVKVVDPKAEKLTEAQLDALKAQFPIYTVTNVPVDGEYEKEDFKFNGEEKIPVKKVNSTTGEWEVVPGQFVSINNHVVDADGYLLDENGDKIQKTNPVYTFSLYNSDVTIVVDYWMILDDDAIVDEPGNKNYAQYGWSPVDNEDEEGNPKTPTNPSDEDKPSNKEEVDEATVYTFAIAWVKINEKGEELADAKFQLPFYVKYATEEKGEGESKTTTVKVDSDNNPVYAKDGKAYIYGVSNEDYAKLTEAEKAFYTNEVTTDESGVITIKGVEQGTYTITETEAPDGYNKLTAPFTVEAKKSGPSVTTKTKTVIYFDANGNITETVTTATEEYETDYDSNTDNVPVYQFDPIVNKQGTELPSTGGIGTTIFYIVGGLLAVGAGVVLVSKKRMGKEDL